MADAAEIRAWAEQAGLEVSAKGAIPRAVRERYDAAHAPGPLPGPDDDEVELDLSGGDWPSEEDIRQMTGPLPAADDGPGPYAGPVPPDDPPADLPRTPTRRKGKGKPPSATVARDIRAKISLGLEVPGQIWAAKDPLCGGVFVRQRPDIAEALTDIVLDSPDLVEFFAGAGGGFMKYLKLAAALAPVAQVIWIHHITHGLDEMPVNGQQPPMPQYAA